MDTLSQVLHHKHKSIRIILQLLKKKLLVLLLLSLVTNVGCTKSLLVTSNIVLTADWLQTRTIAKHPDVWDERNPLLGRHPHTDRVDLYFGSVILVNTLLYYILPDKVKPYWYGGVTVVEGWQVYQNYEIGIRR